MTPEDFSIDRQHLWHPYTAIPDPFPCFSVLSAQGCEITLDTGEVLVDGMASWWSAIHGYNVPELNQAIEKQIQQFSHIMFGGLTHQPAVDLARELLGLLPNSLNKIFYADSGSVSVEVAIKMAIQYWQGHGQPKKNRMASLLNGYHGDTLGAMSVCDPVNGMHSMFSNLLADTLFLPAPPMGIDTEISTEWVETVTFALEQSTDELAAIILEPVVQGAGGMRIYNPAYLSILRSLCDRLQILLIFDEIATGFGRTGKMFALEHAPVVPDILCLGKAITGGYLTLAATITTEAVAEAIQQSPAKVFMHGPTFMGNPLALSVAARNLQLLTASPWQQRIANIHAYFHDFVATIKQHPAVADSRQIGAIVVVELKQSMDMKQIQPLLVQQGVWIRPFGRLLYIMPPYTISESQMDKLMVAMRVVCDSVS